MECTMYFKSNKKTTVFIRFGYKDFCFSFVYYDKKVTKRKGKKVLHHF